MTNKTLRNIICLSDISKAKVLIPNKAVYLIKNVRQRNFGPGPKYKIDKEEFVILLDNDKRIGGIYIMGSWDLHIIIFNKYRGQKHMSNFMKSGWIKQLCPHLESISCIHPMNSKEFKIVKHLAQLAGLKIRYSTNKFLNAELCWEDMDCECHTDKLCKKCAIEQACNDGYDLHEICFDCTQPLEYCNCKERR